jgi:2-amino-4-hydroxy-6-hydroxymethyldihydropteridine diphosphokinase
MESGIGAQAGHFSTAYLGLGSNLGDRSANLSLALALLAGRGVEIGRVSSIYRTEPVEVVDQGEFLNQVVGCVTGLSPEGLLQICLSVEGEMGRVRTRERGPRVIDLDLLLFGEQIRNGSGLELPHPRMHLRRFVLVPLAEIAPEARHPVLRLSASELLTRCPDRSRVERVTV